MTKQSKERRRSRIGYGSTYGKGQEGEGPRKGVATVL
jgi:hypothetical protein